MRKIKLEDLKYENVQESFGMGGPYLGELEIKGKKVRNRFLADNEKFSNNFQFISLVEFKGEVIKNRKFLKIINYQLKKKDFRIVLINTETEEIFESDNLGEALFVEKIEDDKIIYYQAFHNGIEKFQRVIEFNQNNFRKIEEEEFYREKNKTST